MPSFDIKWSVSYDGQLYVSWLRKIALFGETNAVEISWSSSEESGRSIGTANLSIISSLNLGTVYKVHLMDLEEEGEVATFSFEASKIFLQVLEDMS